MRSGSKRSLRLASICSDDVMNGGWGRWVRGVEATDVTVTVGARQRRGDRRRRTLTQDLDVRLGVEDAAGVEVLAGRQVTSR